MRSLRNTLGASIGTALEFYDYTLYGIFAVTFATLFFPEKETATFFSLIIYALSSFLRPFGGIIFGYLSDTQGRKRALMISVLMMATSTLCMGCLPDYADIGVYSLILLIILRSIQGISAGGEYNNTTIYSFESNARYPGFYSGIVVASVTIGTLIAMFLSSFILKLQSPHAWRVPFIMGGLVGFLGLYFRRYLSESPAFEQKSNSSMLSELLILFREYKLALLKTMLIGGFASALSLTVYHYINIYLSSNLSFDSGTSALLSTIGISACMLAIPIFGFLSDIIQARKIILVAALVTLTSAYFIYSLISSGDVSNIISAQLILSLLASSLNATVHPFSIKLFPPRLRCLGISFGCTLGIAIFGGVTPLVCNALIQYTENLLSPSIYLIFISLLVIVILGVPGIKNLRVSPLLLLRE